MASTPIHGNDAWTAIELREESSYGTGAGSWLGVPILRETLHTEYDFAPDTPEFGLIGAVKAIDHLGSRVVGEVQFLARIEGAWFNILLGHLIGEEKYVADTYLDAVADAGGNSHWYLPNAAGRSMQFRIWKSGPASDGNWAIFSGCKIGSARIEFPAGGIVSLTMSFVGDAETIAAISGNPAVPAGDIVSSARWLSNTGASFQTGASLAAIDITSFAINVDNRIEGDPVFLNDLTATPEPGPRGNRIVTVDIGSLLIKEYADAGLPYKEFLDRTASKCQIWLTDTALASTNPYTLMFDFPNIVWQQGQAAVSEAGVPPTSYRFQAIEGATASPAHGDYDWRVGVFVNDADDGDAAYCSQIVVT